MTFSQIWNNGFLSNIVFPSQGSLIAVTLVSGLAVSVLSYLLGSINPAIIVSKKFYGDDIRTHGSGNAGMTNVMRTYGNKMAIITFLGDFLKAKRTCTFQKYHLVVEMMENVRSDKFINS